MKHYLHGDNSTDTIGTGQPGSQAASGDENVMDSLLMDIRCGFPMRKNNDKDKASHDDADVHPLRL